jgi:hypothetical protein
MENDFATSQYIVAFGSAGFGALIGSLSAFTLERWRQKQDEINKNFGALAKTRFILYLEWKVVDGLRMNHLDPLRNDKQRFPKVRAAFFLKPPEVSLTEITYIANSKTPNLLQEIYVAEQSYLKAMIALDLYNQEHVEFEKKYSPIPGTLNEKEASGYVEASKLDIAKGNHYINEVYKRVDLASPQLVETINKIADFAGEHFKGKKLFRIGEQIKTAKKEQVAS